MTIQFVPSIAASGGYDYLVDFLRNVARQAKASEPSRVAEVEELAREVGALIEEAAAQSEASPPEAAAAVPATKRVDELLRKLSAPAG